jgi:hypothetical protein
MKIEADRAILLIEEDYARAILQEWFTEGRLPGARRSFD